MTTTKPASRDSADAMGSRTALPGRPGISRLAGEGFATAFAQPIAMAVAALITAIVCAAVLGTTGQAAATEARVLSQVDQAGARTIVFSDPSGEAGLTAGGLEAVAALDGVEWIAGIGHTVDVRNEPLGNAGNPVPSRALFTDLPPVIEITGGRVPQAGEAIAGGQALDRLGMATGAGVVTGEQFDGPIVGTFTAADPLSELAGGVLIAAPDNDVLRMRSLYVVAESINDVAILEDVVPTLLAMTDRTKLHTESPAVLVDLQRVVGGELGESTRQLMLVVLASGLILVSVTLYGATAVRRRDFGRRRALGASRSAIIVLVLVQTATAAVIGAVVGTGVGIAIVNALEGRLPAWTFTTGVAVLAVLAALIAAVPPALAAAFRDPVRILRVP